MTQNGAKSSLVVEVKEKQESDPILLELKGAINNKRVEVFFQGENGVIFYQGRLCVPDVGELRQHILAEAHNSRYSIHPGATKMYRDLREVYWWNGIKRDIADFVSKCPYCQQVKVEHQKPGCMTQEIDPILLELKGAVNNERVEVMSQGGDGVLRYRGRFCVPNVGELRQHISCRSP